MLKPSAREKRRRVSGGRRGDTCDHGCCRHGANACPERWKVKLVVTKNNTTKKTRPKDGVGVKAGRQEEKLQAVHLIPQDVLPRQIHGDDRPAQLEQRKETPVEGTMHICGVGIV